MNTRSRSLRRAILAGSITALLAVAQGKAASLTWDIAPGDGAAITGGSGIWTDLAGNWNTGAGDANWSNANPDSAIFGDVAGTVSLGGPITVGGITFNSAGYIVQSNTLTLGGATPTITANADATISSLLAGTTGITKAGTGNLTLANTGNTFSGGLTIGASAGTVTATTNTGANVTALGTGAVSVGAGSTLDLQSANTVAAGTTINNAFTGSGLLRLTFNGTTATNTILNNVGGFGGTIQLSNTGTNGDKLNTNNNIGNVAASLVVDNGSQLFVTGGNTANFNGGISIIGTGNSENRGVIRLATGVLGGNISLAGSSTIGLEGGYLAGNISAGVAGTQTLAFGGSQSGNGTLLGNISDGAGTVALTKNNTGTLWLTGTNTYTGATTISANGGRLQLGLGGTTGSLSPSSAISVDSNGSLTFNRSNAMAQGVDFGTISGLGNVTQNGTGTTTFGTATAQAYTGQTQVNRGTLALDFANLATPTDIINPASVLNLGGGTLSVLGNSVGTTAQTFASTTLSAGRSTLAPNRGAGTSTTVTLGLLTSGAGSSIAFTPNTAWAAGGVGTAGAASTTEIVTVSGVTRNGTAITMPGAGSFTFIGANAFNGTGTAARYVVALGSASGPYQLAAMPSSTALVAATGLAPTVVHQLPAAALLTLTAPASSYALITNNGATAATLANGGFTYTANGILGLGTTLATISGAGSVIIGPERDLVVNIANTAGVTVSSVIANNGAGASSVTVSSTGTGVFTPSGANSYTGGTFFNGGTTVITTDGAASANAQLGVVPAAAAPGNLTFNGGTLRLAPTAALILAAQRGIALGASGGTINLTTAFTGTVNSIIAGIGGLTLSNTSSSTLAIGGVNTYTGGTTISGTGVIVPINVASPFGVGGILTLNGGQMRATTTANVTIANPVNIAAVNTTFPTVATEKSLIFTGPAVLSGTRTLTSGVGATVAGTSVQFSNGISESAAGSGLTKAGTGVLTLSGLNTFTGPTDINAGRLAYTKTFALYANNPASWTATNILVASGGTLALSIGGTNEFTSANVDTIAALGTAARGFQSGSFLGLDTTSGNFSYSTTIANPNAGANSLGIMKLGTNTLTLSGANTYTGATAIGGGVLVAANPSAFGPAGNVVNFVLNPSAATSGNALVSGNLELATDTTVNAYSFNGSSSFANTITVNRATAGAGFVHSLGNLSWGANVLTVAAGANVTSGTAGVSFTGMNLTSGGAATSTLNPTTATIAITGPVNIGLNSQPKTLALDGTIAGNSISGDISNNLNTLSLTKSNTSTWTLSGANSYTGATTVNAGTLQLDYGSGQDNSKLSDSAALVLGGGTLDLKGGAHTEIVASATLTANTASRVTSSAPGAVLQMGTITRNPVASIDFAAPNIATTDSPNVNGILGSWATIGGTDWASNSASPGLGLITAATYTDVQRQTAGIILDNAATNVRIVEGSGANNITLGAAITTINTLNQSASGGSSAATIDPAGQTLSTSAILVGTGAGGLTIGTGVNNGILTSATAGGDLALINNTASGLTINSAIADNSFSTLTKTGTGPLTLNGANTYAGGTTLAGGTVTLGNASALGTGTLTLSGGNLDSSVVNLVNANNNVQAWNANFTFVGTQNLDLGAGDVTLAANRQVTVTANTLKVGGVVGGAFSLTKAGAGTLTLAGANTYTGITTVSAGTLTLSGARTAAATGGFNVGTVTGSTGTLNVTDGTFAVGGAGSNFLVGSGIASTGILNQSGGSLTTIGNQLLIGNLGATGTYNLSGTGTLTTIAGSLGVTVGVNTGTTGTFNLSDTGTLTMPATSTLQITRSDNSPASGVTGTFTQTGGTATVGILQMGGSNTAPANNANANATLDLSGGTFTAATFNVLSGANASTSTIHIRDTADVTLPAFPTARGAGSTATINFDGGTLRSLAASATYMGGLTNAFIKAGGARFEIANNITVTQALRTDGVSLGGGFTKAGAGTLTLTGANTYTGKTTVSAGGLTFNSIGDVGAGASALGAPTTVAEGTIDLSGTLTYTGAATSTDRVINLTNAAANSSIFNSGTGLLTLNGDITGGALVLIFRGNGSITMNGIIPATHTGNVTHTENSTLTLTNANNAWTGSMNISKGIVSVASIADKSLASAIGAGTVITLGQSGFNNTGTLQFTGASGGSSDRDIDIQSNAAQANGGIIENTTAGQLLTLSGDITVGGTGTLPTLGLIGEGNGELSGDILGTPALAVTKSGTGTWTLSGTNTYTRATTVTAGTLNIDGTIGAGANVVNANGGTTNFGVSQTLGALNIADGAVATLGGVGAAPAPEFGGGFGGAEAFVTAPAAVPEPGSAALLFGGMLTLLGARRRRR